MLTVKHQLNDPTSLCLVDSYRSSSQVPLESILKDTFKFQNLCSALDNENTFRKEAKLQKRLLQLAADKVLSHSVYEAISPTGSLRRKTHKNMFFYF